jgi:hypothetical protein
MLKRTICSLALLFAALPTFAAITGVVMTTDGAPVAGAKVSISSFDPVESRRIRLHPGAAAPAAIATTQTDAKGAFSFDSPKEALVDLHIDARGYEPTMRRVERDEEIGAVALRKADMKSGTVRANGKAVANAKVLVLYTGADYVTTTDAEGRYSAPDLKNAGRIIVVHPDFAISDETFNTMAPAQAGRADRTLVPGAHWAGKVVGQDNKTPVAKAEIWVDGWPVATTADDGTFTLAHLSPKWQNIVARSGSLMGIRSRASESATTIRLAKAATVSGTVRDSKTQTPIPNAAVRLGAIRANAETEVMLSDAKGNFSFTTAPGNFRITAGHPAYDFAFAQVAAGPGQNVTKTLQIGQLARISGAVIDEDKQPVAAAVVTSEEVRGGDDPMMFGPQRMMRGGGADTRSGPDGRFTIRVADPEVRLNAAKKGLPAGKTENLRVSPGERKRGVTITISRGFELTGKVTDHDGKPLSGVAVSAAEAVSGPAGMMRVMIGGPRQDDDNLVKSGSDGTFSMRLKEGTYDVAFKREGFASKTIRGHAVSNVTKSIETSLDPSVEITGRIVRGGVGLEGVNIFSFAMGSSASQAVSGPDGSFTLSDLSPGSVRVSFNKGDDFVQEVRNLTAPARDVVVDLPPGGRISGRVVDKASKQPVTVFQAGVSGSRGGGGMMIMGPNQMRSFTSDDGTFTLENVAAGTATLMVSAPGYTNSRSSNITVEEGKTVSDVVVEMDTGAKLIGRVTSPDGTPLAGAVVRQTFGNNPMRAMAMMSGNELAATTEANGEYTIEAVEPGEKTFMFTHPDYLPTTKTVDVNGREARLDAQLGAGLNVTGMVVTEAGAPVAEATVRAISASGSASSARSGAGGAFTFDRLAPGRYTITASKPGLADGVLRDYEISAGSQVRIAMKSGGTLFGHVTGLSEADLAQAMVEVRGSEGYATAPLDTAGNYRLEGAPTGTLRVVATVMRGFDRRSTQPKNVELASGDARQLDLEFRTDTAVTGRVTRDGRPVTNANVMFSPRRGGVQAAASVATDSNGAYTVAGLSDGEYNVVVMDMQRGAPYSTTYEVHGSGTFDIDMKAAVLRGRVVDAESGEGIGDVHVQLRAAQQADTSFFAQRGAISDASGNFTIDSVVPGRYSATADKDGYGNQVVDVSVNDAGSNDVQFKLSRNDGVVLHVVDARDGRLLSANATVTDMQGRIVSEEGGFRMGGGSASDLRLSLAPGAYRATVFAYGYATQTISITSPGKQTVGLTPGGTLVLRSKESTPRRARLIDASGQPYSRVGARMPSLTIDVGTTTLQNIAPGTYTLQLLDANDNPTGSVQVQVVEGQTTAYDV